MDVYRLAEASRVFSEAVTRRQDQAQEQNYALMMFQLQEAARQADYRIKLADQREDETNAVKQQFVYQSKLEEIKHRYKIAEKALDPPVVTWQTGVEHPVTKKKVNVPLYDNVANWDLSIPAYEKPEKGDSKPILTPYQELSGKTFGIRKQIVEVIKNIDALGDTKRRGHIKELYDPDNPLMGFTEKALTPEDILKIDQQTDELHKELSKLNREYDMYITKYGAEGGDVLELDDVEVEE